VLLELLRRRKHPVPDSNWLLQEFLDACRNNQVIQLVDPEIAITGGRGASGTRPAVQEEELVVLSLVMPMQPTCSRRRLWNAPSYSASALHGPSPENLLHSRHSADTNIESRTMQVYKNQMAKNHTISILKKNRSFMSK
jgi:hypothetical protein